MYLRVWEATLHHGATKTDNAGCVSDWCSVLLRFKQAWSTSLLSTLAVLFCSFCFRTLLHVAEAHHLSAALLAPLQQTRHLFSLGLFEIVNFNMMLGCSDSGKD